MTESCAPAKKRNQGYFVMSASAYVTTAGIAVAEILDMRPGTRMTVTIAELILFAVILPLTFRAMDGRNRNIFVLLAAVLTALDVGVMYTGPAVHYGAILFFIVCTIVAMRMPLAVVIAWDAAAVGALVACLLLRHQRDWLSTTLTFAAGFAAFVAFAFAFRQSQRARAESEHLLEELTSAQGRLRELAVMEERQRLALEMHDAVGHRLTASAVLLDGAARLIAAEP
jgi:signal transduction histidine kinase